MNSDRSETISIENSLLSVCREDVFALRMPQELKEKCNAENLLDVFLTPTGMELHYSASDRVLMRRIVGLM